MDKSDQHFVVHAHAHPSLALIKYWGKHPSDQKNIPATTSVAVTLDTLQSHITITRAHHGTSSFFLNNDPQDLSSISELQQLFFSHSHTNLTRKSCALEIIAHNNFPTTAGLASSSSGYAALTTALNEVYQSQCSPSELSKIARVGSGSACRSIFGGFTVWERQSTHAKELVPKNHWEDFRVIVLAPHTDPKHISSRDAMIHTAAHSPFYPSWVSYNNNLAKEAIHAITHKDLEKLGALARLSYSAMHASSIAANPPIIYWKPESLMLIALCAQLRKEGIAVWETMDAGPQVKYLTLASHVEYILSKVAVLFPSIWYRICGVGSESSIEHS